MDRRTDPNDQADNRERELARRRLIRKDTGGDLERSIVENGDESGSRGAWRYSAEESWDRRNKVP